MSLQALSLVALVASSSAFSISPSALGIPRSSVFQRLGHTPFAAELCAPLAPEIHRGRARCLSRLLMKDEPSPLDAEDPIASEPQPLDPSASWEFHEAQQSKQYDVVKARAGYYTTTEKGEVDGSVEDFISRRTDALAGGGVQVSEIGDLMEPGADGADVLKYMPSTDPEDPIVESLMKILDVKEVEKFELLDSRWNGNEVMKYVTDKGPFFIKLNRVEDPSVFMSEAVGLTSMIRCGVKAPKPLHVGQLPKVGEFGPGAFMIIEYLPLVPFGSMNSKNQRELGRQLASLHLSDALDEVHKGRFGFVVNNFLSITPLNNTWHGTWPEFFSKRLSDQLNRAFEAKIYGRAALSVDDAEFKELGLRVLDIVTDELGDVEIKPSLLHGDLWIGNTGATKEGPVIFDPASFFGHHEFDLAITHMFGGFSDNFHGAYHAMVPKADGFDRRQRLYTLYHYLNQLNLFGNPQVREQCVNLMREVLGIEVKEPAKNDMQDQLQGG